MAAGFLVSGMLGDAGLRSPCQAALPGVQSKELPLPTAPTSLTGMRYPRSSWYRRAINTTSQAARGFFNGLLFCVCVAFFFLPPALQCAELASLKRALERNPLPSWSLLVSIETRRNLCSLNFFPPNAFCSTVWIFFVVVFNFLDSTALQFTTSFTQLKNNRLDNKRAWSLSFKQLNPMH